MESEKPENLENDTVKPDTEVLENEIVKSVTEVLETDIIKPDAKMETLDADQETKTFNSNIDNVEDGATLQNGDKTVEDLPVKLECSSEDTPRTYNFGGRVKKRKRGRPKGFRPKKKTEDVTEVKETDSNNGEDDIKEETPSIDDTPRLRGRKRGIIYDESDDPATRKEKQKKRAIELKLNKLKICAEGFNEAGEVSGKRQKKAPQRFELPAVEKRKSLIDEGPGCGEYFHTIRFICQNIRTSKLETLRMLHRIVYRKQGMFQEKQIVKNLLKFNGFPFNSNNPEFKIRVERLEKLNDYALKQLCKVLCLYPGKHEEMVKNIINFLLRPSQKAIDKFVSEMTAVYKPLQVPLPSSSSAILPANPNAFHDDEDPALFPMFNASNSKIDLHSPWKKPVFFTEGNGVKLKYIRAVIANIEAASDTFIELMHRLLYLNVDKKPMMRRNILEFSGLNCDIGTPNYIYRVKILSVLPMEQLKLICRVLCLHTWHRSRSFLTDGIMDFLAVPRISAMKKRVPPIFSEEISFSFDSAIKSAMQVNQSKLPGLKTDETEVMEILPDIHISDENATHQELDFQMENDYLGVKLKNFSNIHYQVICTHTSKLADVHMILFLTSAAPHTIRKNILEFSGFPFDENSKEFLCRKTLMQQYSVDALRKIAAVLCVSQYICDDSKKSLIDAILKFLLKPSALLSSSTIMPTISPISQHPLISASPVSVVKKNATSTSEKPKPIHIKPEIVIQPIGTPGNSKASAKILMEAISTDYLQMAAKKQSDLELEKVKARLSSAAIDITPIPMPTQRKEVSRRKLSRPSRVVQPESILPDLDVVETIDISEDESLPPVTIKPPVKINKEAPSPPNAQISNIVVKQCYSSDDDDDQPLSKMVGHPNDDQLKSLVSKIIKESKLEDITMKLVVKKVFKTYPNYDLSYRKEFIKSNVRMILSQMDDQNCSVSTTVINI